MAQIALSDDTEIILDVEAHREARRIWRQRQNEEANPLRKVRLEFRDGAAGAKLGENGFSPFFLETSACFSSMKPRNRLSASKTAFASEESAQNTVEASPIWIRWPLLRSRNRLSAAT